MAFNFKDDDSFLRKLVIGAEGTKATINQLSILGFQPIELERGSTGYKIWKKIKIKRIRVPDILCLKTGLRFESRGKTKPEISMSHSLKDPRRAWDAGMKDNDFVSIVVFDQNEDFPLKVRQISPIHFAQVSDMREAFNNNLVSITKPKGIEEGSEIRVIWTCAAANEKSKVILVDSNKIKMTSIGNGKSQTKLLNRPNGKLIPLVTEGEIVEANQIVASIIPLSLTVNLSANVDEQYFINKLTNVNLSERYASAKALRYRGYENAKETLFQRMTDSDEDIYVQLESAAALATYNENEAWEFIENKLRTSTMSIPLETQLETIIVISEIQNERSEKFLIEVLKDVHKDEELRAGAAWALGQFATNKSADALVETFNSSPVEIKVEAARALLQIADPQIPYLVSLLRKSDPQNRDGLSWVLAKTGKFNPASIIDEKDENLNKWISYIVGFGKEKFLQKDIELICKADPKIYFAASVLWQLLESWVKDLKEY